MDYEKTLRVNELASIIRLHEQASAAIKRFREAYPYLVAPNLLKMLEDNLRENVIALNKELAQLQMGGKRPGQDPARFVCKQCHQKFTVALRGGLCDECRAKQG